MLVLLTTLVFFSFPIISESASASCMHIIHISIKDPSESARKCL